MKIDGKHYRTIWPKKDDTTIIQIIEQRHLPHQFVIEDLATVDHFAKAIEEMHVRGAGLIGATAGFAFYSALVGAPAVDLEAYIESSSAKLIATRPTAKNLAWAIDRQKNAIRSETTLEAKRNKAYEVACQIADEDADFCRRLGLHGLEIIKEISQKKNGAPVNILTHCNAGWLAFVDYGSATAPIYAAHEVGINVHVWVDETRPWLQGSRLTAWELGQQGVAHTLIPDNTGGHLMQHGMVDLVIVGTDRTTRSGDVANKIGTYLKALAAHDNGVPFYVALPSSTFDWQIRNGIKEIPIEQRSDDEIKYITGQTAAGTMETVLISPKETKGANYGFDVTPARLISGLITERGITPANEADIIALYPEHQ
nr:S-methyl-5-thioribose-1-phosphate isomerase [Desulfobulbaceae bacterium]